MIGSETGSGLVEKGVDAFLSRCRIAPTVDVPASRIVESTSEAPHFGKCTLSAPARLTEATAAIGFGHTYLPGDRLIRHAPRVLVDRGPREPSQFCRQRSASSLRGFDTTVGSRRTGGRRVHACRVIDPALDPRQRLGVHEIDHDDDYGE